MCAATFPPLQGGRSLATLPQGDTRWDSGEGVMRTCRPPSWNKMELNVDGNPAHRDPPAPRKIDGTDSSLLEAVLTRRLRCSSTCFTCVLECPVMYFISIIFNG
ncbi:unnamed protein product [Lasius platythorax]|uniref:Uncharacterized protein n=1 Tax=Lasius platythorax TaxID=488582 RepID=A0AAV2P7B9_9HYME